MKTTFQDMVGSSLLMVFSHMREWETEARSKENKVTHNCKSLMQDSDGYQDFEANTYYIFVDDVLAGKTVSRNHAEHVAISHKYLRTFYGKT